MKARLGRFGARAFAVSTFTGSVALATSALFMQSEEEAAIEAKTHRSLAKLLPVDVAGATAVVPIRNLLTASDVATLLAAADRVKKKCGRTGRDSDGSRILANAPWETIYLQTAHAYKEEPELNRLIDKVANAAWAAAIADGSSSPLDEKHHPSVRALATATEEPEPALKLKTGGLQAMAVPPTETLLNTNPLSAEPSSRCRLGPHVVKDLRRSDVNLRVVELHTVERGGALPNPEHFDGGSVLTVDVMLSDSSKDFTGGRFCTPEPQKALNGGLLENGTRGHNESSSNEISSSSSSSSTSSRVSLASSRPDEELLAHRFEMGDALVFASHKRHCVTPVESGTRRVLVMELWCGEPRQCAHRCELHWGHCWHTRWWAAVERLMASDADP